MKQARISLLPKNDIEVPQTRGSADYSQQVNFTPTLDLSHNKAVTITKVAALLPV